MTPSPVVGPDRSGGRTVKTNVDHKIEIDARVRTDAAGRKVVAALASKPTSRSPLMMV
jgi:hypothetical protein